MRSGENVEGRQVLEMSGDLWAKIVFATVALVAWIVRLEAKVKNNIDKIKEQEMRLSLLESKILEEIKVLGQNLAKIQGKLGIE